MNENVVNLPSEYLKRMEAQLGSDFEKYINSLSQPAIRGLRVNLNRISSEEFQKHCGLQIKKLSTCDDGFMLCQIDKLGNSSGHLSGLYYLQEPSSMIPVIASRINEEERPVRVLDLCAAPGGKTGQIVQRVQKDSLIISNEIIKSRAEALFSNVERQGFTNVIITNEEPKNLLCFEGYFDYVFVDAPCSGEGMFRKNPETINEWSEKNVIMCAERQREILEVAQRLVCKGGKLIYSTCTFSKEEDEDIVDWFTQNYNYEILDVPSVVKCVTLPSKAISDKGEFSRKFFPFTGEGEGQFVCVFKNLDEEEKGKMYCKKHFNNIFLVHGSEYSLLKEFSQNSLQKDFEKERLYLLKNNLYYVPKVFDEKLKTALDTLKVISIGVKLGSVEKRRFEPNHSIFMAFFDLFKEKIELSDEMLKKYLHGEELNYDTLKNGYAVLLKDGYPIGGGKLSCGKIKNLYPKGLRI